MHYTASSMQEGIRKQVGEIMLFLLGLVFFAVLFFYWGHFLILSSKFARQTESGLNQVSTPSSEKEAIVVLTGDEKRIARSIELLKHRGSPHLIISGVHKGVPLEDIINRQVGASVGIHQTWEKIIAEESSTSTIENAENSGAILVEKEIDQVILVTSDYHMIRALSIFKEALPSMKYIPFAVESHASDLLKGSIAPSFSAFSRLIPESVKYLVYSLGMYPTPRVEINKEK